MISEKSENNSDRTVGDIAALTFGQAVSRGLRLRCPACGCGRMFHGLFRMNQRCGDCGFLFERPPGYFLGSTYINYGVTALTTTVLYVWLYFGVGIEKQVLLPPILIFCLVFPLVFFRVARSLWLSLDCFIDRVGALEAMSGSRRTQSGSEVENNGD